MTALRPSLRNFECQVANRDTQGSLETALLILGSIDSRYGGLNGVEFDDIESDEARGDFELEFCTRFAASFGRLIIDPDLAIKAIDYEHLLLRHRWIDLIFTLSGFRSSDPFLRQLGNAQGENKLAIEDANLPRFLAMLTLNSRVVTSIDFELDPADESGDVLR